MQDGTFSRIVNQVMERSSLQRKKIEPFLQGMDADYFARAEAFASRYCRYLEKQELPLEYAVDAYLEMCSMMLKSQIEFMRTGSYSTKEVGQAYDEVYSNRERMTSYMVALALSQFLWRTHYRIFRCFEESLAQYGDRSSSYLEIGPGHGLYLDKALDYLKPQAQVTAVDISPVSIAITRSIIEFFRPEAASSVSFCNGDILAFNESRRYGFITMGEVLEHVNFPQLLLTKVGGLLEDQGRAFISTSINSPAVDHVYHYRSVDEVREMIDACGLALERELVLPVEELPMEEIVARRITTNYCALLKRKSNG